MAAGQSKVEKLTAKALAKRGVWFREQVQIEVAGAKRVVSFVLRSSSGKKLIVDVSRVASPQAPAALKKADAALRAARFVIVRVSDEKLGADPGAFVAGLIKQFKPQTAAQNRREVSAALNDVRKMIQGAKLRRLPGQ